MKVTKGKKIISGVLAIVISMGAMSLYNKETGDHSFQTISYSKEKSSSTKVSKGSDWPYEKWGPGSRDNFFTQEEGVKISNATLHLNSSLENDKLVLELDDSKEGFYVYADQKMDIIQDGNGEGYNPEDLYEISFMSPTSSLGILGVEEIALGVDETGDGKIDSWLRCDEYTKIGNKLEISLPTKTDGYDRNLLQDFRVVDFKLKLDTSIIPGYTNTSGNLEDINGSWFARKVDYSMNEIWKFKEQNVSNFNNIDVSDWTLEMGDAGKMHFDMTSKIDGVSDEVISREMEGLGVYISNPYSNFKQKSSGDSVMFSFEHESEEEMKFHLESDFNYVDPEGDKITSLYDLELGTEISDKKLILTSDEIIETGVESPITNITILPQSTTMYSFDLTFESLEEVDVNNIEVSLETTDEKIITIKGGDLILENITPITSDTYKYQLTIGGLESGETYRVKTISIDGYENAVDEDNTAYVIRTIPDLHIAKKVSITFVILLSITLIPLLIWFIVKRIKMKKQIKFHIDPHHYKEGFVELALFNTHKHKVVAKEKLKDLELFFLDKKMNTEFLRETTFKKGLLKVRLYLNEIEDFETVSKTLTALLHQDITIRKDGIILKEIKYVEGRKLNKTLKDAVKNYVPIELEDIKEDWSEKIKHSEKPQIESKVEMKDYEVHKNTLGNEEIERMKKLPLISEAKKLGIMNYDELTFDELQKEIIISHEINSRLQSSIAELKDDAYMKSSPKKNLSRMSKEQLLKLACEIYEEDSLKGYTKADLIELLQNE